MSERHDREDLFDRIIKENERRLTTLARSFARGEQREDLYQEIVLQIWKSLDRYEERSRAGTWTYRVALNTAIRFSRKAALRRRTTDRIEDEAALRDPAKPGPLSQGRILEDFLHSLGEGERGLFLLCLENLSNREIAEITSLDEDVVRTRISRLKKKYVQRYIGT